MECLTCKSLKGEISLTPGPIIYNGTYWQVEHAYPVGIKGWLVIILKRHTEALHDLTPQEFAEFTKIQEQLTKLLAHKLNSQKEYLFCYAEKEGFQHIHFHLVSISKDLEKEFRGANIFSLLGVEKEKAIPEAEVIKLCESLQQEIKFTTTG